MARQLLLGVLAEDPATLENFLAGPNAEVVEAVRAAATGARGAAVTWLHGAAGTGKSHLLRAGCRHAAEHGTPARYLDPGSTDAAGMPWRAAVSQLVCIDDAERMAGDEEAERALFNVLLDAQRRRARVLLAASSSPAGAGFRLPALASRVASGPVYRLAALRDAEKVQALQLRARCRGLEMPPAVARYMMRRSPRDMSTLFALLDRLDTASMVEGRRLTVPFLRSLLGSRADIG